MIFHFPGKLVFGQWLEGALSLFFLQVKAGLYADDGE